jgi:putative heme degradation protein
MSVWLLYVGEYSDRGVHGVFTTEALARAAYDALVAEFRAEVPHREIRANMAESFAPPAYDVEEWRVDVGAPRSATVST